MNTRNLICFIVLLYTQSMVAQTCPSLTYNGKTYQTVQIGTQCWMAENLNDNGHTAGVSSTYDEDNTYLTNAEKQCIADKFGRLYDWAAAKDIDSKIEGWHLPTDAEWNTLSTSLGGMAGAKMKVGGSSGFNALFAGYQNSNGSSIDMSRFAYFWSSTASGSSNAWNSYIYSNDVHLYIYNNSTDNRYSVRLLKD